MRDIPRNLQVEPPYPGLNTVCFSIRYPDWTIHRKSSRCGKDWPHKIDECGEFELEENNADTRSD